MVGMATPADPADPAELVDRLEALLVPLETAAGRAWWNASVDASDANDRARVAAEIAYTEALSDRERFAAVVAALATVDAVGQPLVHRRLTLLHDAMAPNQIDPALNERIIELGAEVDSAFSSFRGVLGDRRVNDNDIAEILRSSDDVEERRAAWEASKQVGALVADRVLELVRLRNEAARGLGFRDHFQMALSMSELDESDLFATLDEVDAATAGPFAEWKLAVDAGLAERFGCEPADLRPWHYDNVFFQSPPAGSGVDLDPWFHDADLVDLTARTYDGIGIDVAATLERSDLEPREGKNQHAFCADLDRSGDVRVLCNNVPNEEWAEVMLHEFGHAVYDLGIDPELPWGLRTMHPLTTEGVAMMFEKLAKDPTWLVSVAGVPAAEVDALAPKLAAARRGGLLTMVRWVLVMTTFERGLYADPDADHERRWWDLVERFQLITRPDGRSAPDWAAKIHLASAPVYYQNYLLGELVAQQLRHTIEQRYGGLVGVAAAGEFLRTEFFGPGASVRWDDLVRDATGHPLTATHLVEALSP